MIVFERVLRTDSAGKLRDSSVALCRPLIICRSPGLRLQSAGKWNFTVLHLTARRRYLTGD